CARRGRVLGQGSVRQRLCADIGRALAPQIVPREDSSSTSRRKLLRQPLDSRRGRRRAAIRRLRLFGVGSQSRGAKLAPCLFPRTVDLGQRDRGRGRPPAAQRGTPMRGESRTLAFPNGACPVAWPSAPAAVSALMLP